MSVVKSQNPVYLFGSPETTNPSPILPGVTVNAAVAGPAARPAAPAHTDVFSNIVAGQTVFVLSHAPTVPSSVSLIIDSTPYQAPDISVNGTQVTWSSRFALSKDDTVQIQYT
jgi:hypothetical protein